MMIYDDVKFVDSKKKLVSIETNNKRTKGQTTSITENYLKKHISVISYHFNCSRFSFTCICSFCIVAINIQTVHYTNHLTRRN